MDGDGWLLLSMTGWRLSPTHGRPFAQTKPALQLTVSGAAPASAPGCHPPKLAQKKQALRITVSDEDLISKPARSTDSAM
jgi:hypothetical protein